MVGAENGMDDQVTETEKANCASRRTVGRAQLAEGMASGGVDLLSGGIAGFRSDSETWRLATWEKRLCSGVGLRPEIGSGLGRA